MIKKLKKQFIIISMAAISAVILILLVSINLGNYLQMTQNSKEMIQTIYNYGGTIPQVIPDNHSSSPTKPNADGQGKKHFGSGFEVTEETPFETRYFTVTFDSSGNVKSSDTSHIASIDDDKAKALAIRALTKQKTEGKAEGGNFRYGVIKEESGDTVVIFLNIRSQLNTLTRFLDLSLIIALSAIALVFILISIFSQAAIKPYAESFEKQKRFITDASHEIKTPLAIIMADCDVLEIEDEDNKWIKGIKKQVARLSSLVASLLALAKMDEENAQTEHMKFNLSDTIIDVASPFEAAFKQAGKTLETNVPEDIYVTSNEGDLRQILSILIDNSLKYSLAKTKVQLFLSSQKSSTIIKIQNKCQNISKKQISHMFDRFWRSDESRSRESGGYGLGLCIAQSLMEKNKGNLSVKMIDDSTIEFIVKIN